MSEKGKKFYPTVKKTIIKSKNKLKTIKPKHCSNTRPLPSLADLEKMFEDSNDSTLDINSNNSEVNNNQSSQEPYYSHTIFKDIPDSPDSLDATDCLNVAASKPGSKIHQQKEPSTLNYNMFKIQQPNPRQGNNYTIDLTSENDDMYSTPPLNASTASFREFASQVNCDDNGNDSDSSAKTIIYDYNKRQTFSPLPSTSTDMETIKKNDDMFSNSIIEIERRLSEANNTFNYKDLLIGCSDKDKTDAAQVIPMETSLESPNNDVELIEEPVLIEDTIASTSITCNCLPIKIQEKKKLEFFPWIAGKTIIIDDYKNNNHINSISATRNNFAHRTSASQTSNFSRVIKPRVYSKRTVKPMRNLVRYTENTQRLDNDFDDDDDDEDDNNVVLYEWMRTNRPDPTFTSYVQRSYERRRANTESINLTNETSRKRPNCNVNMSEEPRKKPNQTQKPKGGIGDCPICLESLLKDNIVSTLCGHLFCRTCIDAALKIKRRCPTCRKYLQNRYSYHPIFL